MTMVNGLQHQRYDYYPVTPDAPYQPNKGEAFDNAVALMRYRYSSRVPHT